MEIAGILSLVLSIAGLITSYWYVGAVLCLIGIVLGAVGTADELADKKFPIAGILLSILGIVMSAYFTVSDLDSGKLLVYADKFIKHEKVEEVNDFMRFHKEGWTPEQEGVEVAAKEPEKEEEAITDSEEEKLTPYWIHDVENAINTEEPMQSTTKDLEPKEESLYSENTGEQDKKDETENKDNILTVLQDMFGENTGNKAFDILVNQIGFTEVEYIGKNPVGTDNYDFKSNECDFTVTAFKDDDVYRVFRPYGTVFYENGETKDTIKDFENRKIGSDDEISYYIMAQEIVSNNLKNPKSAEFPSIVIHPEEIAIQRNGNIVGVKSYVDSKNDFGVAVRNDWIVEFEVVDIGTFSYNLLYANIGGEKIGEFIELN